HAARRRSGRSGGAGRRPDLLGCSRGSDLALGRDPGGRGPVAASRHTLPGPGLASVPRLARAAGPLPGRGRRSAGPLPAAADPRCAGWRHRRPPVAVKDLVDAAIVIAQRRSGAIDRVTTCRYLPPTGKGWLE